MILIRVLLVAGLSFADVAPYTVQAQTVKSPQTRINPFVTLALGPGVGQTAANERGNKSAAAHPVLDFTVGARKRLTGKFGVVLSTNAGRTFDKELSGGELSCRVQIIDGKTSGCLPNDPLLDWFGASAGGEAYLGRAIIGLQFGPASYGTREYERDPFTAQKPGREVGLRSQLNAQFPLYRRLVITLSAVRGNVPKILGDRMSVTSMSAGLTLRPYR